MTRIAQRAPLGICVLLLALAPSSVARALVVNEIMYHSEDVDDRPFEWIELYNEHLDPMDLSDHTMCNGVELRFPRGTWIDGHSYIVICSDLASFESKYSVPAGVEVIQWQAGQLDNGGERLELCNPGGRALIDLRYNDRGKWAVAADGAGHTLALVDPFTDISDADNWRHSLEIGGTPGEWNGLAHAPSSGPPSFNGMDGSGFITDWLLLGPYTGAGCEIGLASLRADWLREADNSPNQTDLVWRDGQVVNTSYASAASTGLHPNASGATPRVELYDGFSSDIDFNVIWAPDPNDVMAYAFTYVDNVTGSNLPVTIALASDDSVQVLLNGTEVHINDVCRGAGGAGTVQDRADAVLQPGKNLIAVKVFERGGGWVFRLRIEERVTQQPITSPSKIQVTTDVDAGLGFDGSGEPILPIDDPGPGPGDDELPGTSPVVINEGFFRTAGERWIELYNRSSQSVDLAGYYITDDKANLAKAEIAGPLSLPAGGFVSFSETDLGLDFSIVDGVRERIFLALVEPTGDLVADAYNFEPKLDGFSEARQPDGDREFDDGSDPTRNAPNAMSPNDDIVINEVMYHAIDDDRGKEYIELYNRGAAPVDVSGWALTRGVDFTIPPGVVIAPDSYLVIARDPQRIQSIHGLGPDAVIGPSPDDPVALDDFGGLRNSGERITLKDELGRTVDTVSFADGGEWPRWADGYGASMELIDPLQDNRVGQAWDASDDSSKAQTREFSYVGRHGGGEPELHVLLLTRGISVIDDISVIGGGISYDDTPIIEVGEQWRYFKGTEEPPADWADLAFNDGAWLTGATGIGYGDGDDATVLDDMQDSYVSVFCRKEFTVADPSAIDQLWLNITIDDGLVAYLNGEEVARFNQTDQGDGAVFDDTANSAIQNGDLVETDITSRRDLLVSGTNVLAVRVHNTSLGSSDLTFIPRLVDRTISTGGGAEFVVNGEFESNTSGWMIQGNHILSGRTTQEPITGGGSLKLIASGRGDNKVNRLETPQANGFGLGNLPTGEDLSISFKARWVVGSQTLLTHGYQHAMAQAHALHVPENLGTPGRVNSVTLRQIARSGGNLGPVMTDLKQDPAVPEGGEDVTVTVLVSDSDGVVPGSVELHYSLNNPSATPARLTMAALGGGFYRATIPGRPLGTKVVFFITAEDQLGERARYPVDISERTHPLVLRPEAPGLNDQRYFIYRHDTRLPTTPYHSYRFVMTDAIESELASRLNLSNHLLPGSFIYGGDRIYHEAFARFSGSPFARGSWGSFRVAMPRGNLLHETIRKFNLDTHHGSPTNARERISHYLIRNNQGSISVPYSHLQTLARWQVNDRSLGNREHVWVPDVQFVSLWHPDDDDGDFIEMDDRFVISDSGSREGNTNGELRYPPSSPRSTGDGEDKENYRWFFGLRAKNGADDYSSFIEFCRIMDPGATSNAQFDQEIWNVCDVEEFLRIWAVRLNTDDWDQWGGNRGKNCYFYQPAIERRWKLYPWDMELTYGSPGAFALPTSPTSAYNPGQFGEVHRLLNRPAIKRMYYAILDEMVNGPDRWFHSSYLSTYMNKLAAIGMSNTGIGQPGGFIDQRAENYIIPRIRDVVYPQTRLEITTNGGADLTTDQLTVTLRGIAPVEANSFSVVNGADSEIYPVTFTSMTGWRVDDIGLHPGVNELTVLGFDLRGAFVDSDEIVVTSTATEWDPPEITSVVPAEALPGETVEITGLEFHDGLQVFFGGQESPDVVFDESGPASDTILAEVPAGLGLVDVVVRNVDGKTSNSFAFTILEPPPTFVRGDSNRDGVVDLSDSIRTLLHLFGGVAITCEDAADADDNEAVEITDAIFGLEFLFRGGAMPPAPFPQPGFDPGGDGIGCEE